MNHTYIIAEAGVNHNGSLELAIELVNTAVSAGADAVKFQTFRADQLVTITAPKANYQRQTTDAQESQYQMIKALELDESAHYLLKSHCDKQNIEFLSTPFDLLSVEFLVEKLAIPRIKIASGEITNAPLLLKIAQTDKSVILSTGMSTLGDIENALALLAFGYTHSQQLPNLVNFQKIGSSEASQRILREKITLLHCTTEYPAPLETINLRALDTLKQCFGLPVGYSDHTAGIAIPIAAVARGAVMIEKHLTLDKNLPGPDHQASLEPIEFKEMVTAIRQVEQAVGNGIKMPAECEWKNRDIARKSLVAARNIQQNESFTSDNLTVKRPGTGISPLYYWDFLGKTAQRNYAQDDIIVD